MKSWAQGNLAGKEQIRDSHPDRLVPGSWRSLCVCVCVHAAPHPQCGPSPHTPAAPLPVSLFPNLLHKVLLMTGFLEVDTVRALFPHYPPPARALGLSSGRQTAWWLPKWAWASQVSRATPGTASASAEAHAQSGRGAPEQSQRHPRSRL